MQVILDSDADFVCLQEVVEKTRDLLSFNEHIKSKFPFRSYNDFGQSGYGVMILTKYPCYFFKKDFDS